MRLQARIARLEAAVSKPTRDSEVSQAELRERSEQLLLSLNRLQAEWRRREMLPLEAQLALQRQDLVQMRFKQRNAPHTVPNSCFALSRGSRNITAQTAMSRALILSLVSWARRKGVRGRPRSLGQ
jgi:hypothetical protein